MAFSPDSRYVVSGAEIQIGKDNNTLKLWNIATGQLIHSFLRYKKSVNSIKFSPDGRYVLTGSNDGYVKLWDVFSGNIVYTFNFYDLLNAEPP